MYLTYEEYKNIGGELDDTAFNKYGYEAEKKVSAITHKRIYNVGDDVKGVVVSCIVRITDIINKASVTGEAKLVSSSHDGLSQNYSMPTQAEYESQINDIIYNYLIDEKDLDGVPLLYRGCSI